MTARLLERTLGDRGRVAHAACIGCEGRPWAWMQRSPLAPPSLLGWFRGSHRTDVLTMRTGLMHVARGGIGVWHSFLPWHIPVAGVDVTPDRILDALLTTLAAETGRGRGYWRRAIGVVHVRPAREGWLCNWYVEPHGERDALVRIEEAVRRVRDDHPRVHEA